MNAHQAMVQEFHAKYEHAISSVPIFLNELDKELRILLIHQEFYELVEAMFEEISLSKIADALGDLLYVVYGTAVSYGIDMEPVMCEIHRSNMTKSKSKDQFGKTIKGKDFSPVNPEMFWVH